MKKTIPILLVALITFLGVFLFLGKWDEGDKTFGQSKTIETGAQDPLDHVRVRRTDESQRITEEPLSPAAQAPQHGELVILTDGGSGLKPAGLQVVTTPSLDDLLETPEGFAQEKVDPAAYQITVWGGDIIPVTKRAVRVKAGHRTTLDLRLERGVKPRGLLLHALDRRPIAGATIDFNGAARIVTDSGGAFEIHQLLPKSALRVITIRHDQFDDQTYRDLALGDHRSLELFLGGDEGVIVAEIVNSSGRPIPERYVVKVTVEPLWDVRREFEVENLATFRVENLYLTRYRVEVHFPGGEFPALRELVKIPRDTKVANVRLELTVGGTLAGRFLAPLEDIVSGTKLELRDQWNKVVAECRADEKGAYRIAGLKPGRYHPCLVIGANVPRFLPALEVSEGETTINRDIDLMRGRFVNP